MEQDPDLPGMHFHALHHAFLHAVQAELAALGLGGLGSPLLMMLLCSRGQDGEIPPQRELARTLHITPAAVAMSLKSLERLGYVERRTDKDDQRRKRVTVTQYGLEAEERCRMAFQAIDTCMMEGFSPAEREQLNRYFQRMLQNLSGVPGGTPGRKPLWKG